MQMQTEGGLLFLGSFCIKLRLKFRKNRCYHENRTAHWDIVTSFLLKAHKQRSSTSLRALFLNRFTVDPFCSNTLIISVLLLQLSWIVNFRDQIPDTSVSLIFFFLFFYFSNYCNFFRRSKYFICECSHVVTLPVSC
jgi:hypothetical protein